MSNLSHPGPGSDSRVDAYVRLVRVADKVFAEVSRGLAQHGVTATQFSALKALCYKGPLNQKELAKSILKSSGNVTMVIGNMERDGFVTRTRSDSDRRVFQVEVTPMGRELFEALYPEHLARIRKSMSGLDPKAADLLSELLERLA